MPRIRILGTEAFRLTALFATLFLGLTGALLLAVYWIVAGAQQAALVAAVDADIRTVMNGYRDEGVPEAVEVVDQRLGTRLRVDSGVTDVYILLADRSRGKIAGNLPLFPPQIGLTELDRVPAAATAARGAILGRGVYVADGVYLYVGRDTRPIAKTRARIARAFGWIGCAAIVIAACGGIFFSVQFLRRIDAITATCQAIIAGRFTDRIALRGNDDELDRLAGVINAMLDRIGGLMDNLRQVSSDVAHDLRTPLTHLRNRLEEARLHAVSAADYSAAVARAIEDTDQLLAVFAALLRISQVESGSRRATLAELSLSEVLQRAVDLYAPAAEDRGQSLRADIAPGVRIRGDGELLLQACSNLIENAMHHTPPGTHIVVALAQAGDDAVASVADDGPGIPEGERDKVLQRFYRLAASRTTPGNGLGLALVAAIAELHGAKLELGDNRPGLRVSLRFSPGAPSLV